MPVSYNSLISCHAVSADVTAIYAYSQLPTSRSFSPTLAHMLIYVSGGFVLQFSARPRHAPSTQSESLTPPLHRSSPRTFLERVLTRRGLSSRPVIDLHGSLGLNLLHCPSEPLLDLIFVHGLGGGSTKTWCSSGDPTLFWPRSWLPREPGFRNVRIHSYGYDADWTSTKATPTINVHDFGHQLLERIRTSSEITSSRTVCMKLSCSTRCLPEEPSSLPWYPRSPGAKEREKSDTHHY